MRCCFVSQKFWLRFCVCPDTAVVWEQSLWRAYRHWEAVPQSPVHSPSLPQLWQILCGALRHDQAEGEKISVADICKGRLNMHWVKPRLVCTPPPPSPLNPRHQVGCTAGKMGGCGWLWSFSQVFYPEERCANLKGKMPMSKNNLYLP